MKILIAEDSLTQATLMKLALQHKGYEIVLARDGIEAIKKAYQERPDLVVSDVVMPRVNGYQVCRLLRDDQKTAHIPVILLTSLDQRQDAFWGLKSGAEKFITKGGDIPALVEEIHGFIVAHEQHFGGAGAEVRVARAPVSEDLDADVMERVIHLLDRNLFESTVVTEIQNLVNSMEDFRKTMLGVLEILKNVIDFHVGAILLGGEENQGLFMLVNKPVDQGFLDRVREHTLRESLQEDAAPDLEVEVFDPEHCLSQAGAQPLAPGSVLVTALTTKGRRSGAITLADAAESAYPERVEKTFAMIVRQANIIIDYARLYERNKQLSITDGLTKLYNHRYFQEALKREFARSARQKAALSLIMLDIDRFKSFNDTYGHQQGDIVLQELARILRGHVRSLDIVSRYGGEEFAVIMPDAPEEVSLRVAERLRAAVESHPVAGPEGALQVTISLGLAIVPHPEITSPTGLITIADRALYRAKERGRNRVEH